MPLSQSTYVQQRGLVEVYGLRQFHPAVRYLWRIHMQGVLRRDLEHTLTVHQFARLIKAPCTFCGQPPYNQTKLKTGENIAYTGLDRMDNAQGYTVENTVPCCKICNSMKGEMGPKEFVAHVQKIVGHLWET